MAENRNSLRGIPCHMPVLATRQPKIAVPPGACDTHFHLFSKPFIANPPYTPPDVGLAEYRNMIAALGIERAVIVQTALPRDTSGALAALRASNGQWRAIALPDPDLGDAQWQEMHDAGFRGVRFNPYYDAETELRHLEAIVARIKPLGWHAQFHLDARNLPALAPRLKRLGIGIVIDHFGHMPLDAPITEPGFQLMLQWLREKRCWVKLSAPMRVRRTRR